MQVQVRQQRRDCRGRNAGYPAPPAQIRASGTTAHGSCLGCLASKRTLGLPVVLLPAHESTPVTRRPDPGFGACWVSPCSPWPGAFPPHPPLAVPRFCSDASPVLCSRPTPPPRSRWTCGSCLLQPARSLLRAPRGAPGSRALSFRTCAGPQTARGPRRARPVRSPGCGLPLGSTASAPRTHDFAARYPACSCPGQRFA